MRIAIATAVYHPMINGVAVFSYNLAKGLAARGHEVLVLCPSQTGREYVRREEGVLVQYLAAREIKLYPDQIYPAKKVPRGERLEKRARALVDKLSCIRTRTLRQGRRSERSRGNGLEWWPKKYEHGLRVAVWPRKAVFEALDDFRPEVVHVQVADMIGGAAEKWARRNGVPVVATEHNQAEVLVEPLGVPQFLAQPMEDFLAGYFRRRLNRSDFATMPTREAILNLATKKNRSIEKRSAVNRRGKSAKGSSNLGGRMAEGFSGRQQIRTPIAAVSNGVDLANFRPGKAAKEIYAKYGIDKEAPTVLYVGRVDPEKKVEVVLKAFRRMLRGDGKVDNDVTASTVVKFTTMPQLVIVGDGVARKGLQKLADELGIADRVHFFGRVVPPELFEIYRLGDVFATASEIETQGIVSIEAAASELPLIAVDKGAVSEICINGEDGFLCRPRDVVEMAEAMEKILTDAKLRRKMSEKAVVEAGKHDMARTLEQFENIYRKVMEKRPGEGA